jgi:lysophosphatidic acid acyltransferase / lysophosphatidylinositol acyltransferase
LVRRIPLDQIPYEDEAKCAQFVHKLYQEKDKIYDTYFQKGTYASLGYPITPLIKNYYDLYFSIFWSIIVLTPTFYYLTIFFTSSSLIGKLLIIVISILRKYE